MRSGFWGSYTKYTTLLFALLLAVACGDKTKGDFSNLQSNGPTGEGAELISAFGVEAGSSAGALVAFYGGKKYFVGVVQRIAANVYRIAASVGYYEQAGNEIKFSARKTTCRRLHDKDKSKQHVAGSPEGQSLLITNGAHSLFLKRITPASTTAGASIQWGCFDEAGRFTPEAWSDVN